MFRTVAVDARNWVSTSETFPVRDHKRFSDGSSSCIMLSELFDARLITLSGIEKQGKQTA